VLALGNGHEVVADAGGNTLVDVQGRRARLLTVVRGVGGRQSVPTSLALGPDGAIYVGELVGSGKKGGARVLRVVPGSKPTVFRTGFTNITGVAFGPDGSLFVTQMANAAGEPSPANTAGSVVKVSPDGATRTVLGRGSLFLPQGAAVDATGAVYVSNWSILPGKAAPAGPFKGKNGQLVRIAPTA
jgi:sugar lactone lactonase YvrE